MKNSELKITSKDLDYLNDAFNWNMIAFKNIQSILKCVKKENLKYQLQEISKVYQNNMKDIIKIMEAF